GYNGQTADLSSSPNLPAIAALAAHWTTATDSSDMVLSKFDDTDGDGVADRLILQWNNVYDADNGGSGVTVQAILALNTGAASGDVLLNYINSDAGNGIDYANAAVVGVRGAAGDPLTVQGDNAVGSGLAVRFVAGPRYAGTDTVTVNNVAPVVASL